MNIRCDDIEKAQDLTLVSSMSVHIVPFTLDCSIKIENIVINAAEM